MSWWKTALYDTCSLITLDKLLLERAALVRHFSTTIMALEESFAADQLREETAKRMRPRVTLCPLPTPAELATILASAKIPKALAQVDKLIYATAVHRRLSVVTADIGLARAIRQRKIKVCNMAMILRDLVLAKKLTKAGCVKLLLSLASRKDFVLGIAAPCWADLRDHSFP
jgi:hypothetical protein